MTNAYKRMKKSEAENEFVQDILNSGGIWHYYVMYEHGNYYYCFDLYNGTRRYWMNISKESKEKLGIEDE